MKIADIARRQHIPQKFLELILAGLKQGGFVESRRGAEGGYLLAKPADSIMIGDSGVDVATAKAAGVPVIGVSFGYTETPVREFSPDVVIDHFSELEPAIARLMPC